MQPSIEVINLCKLRRAAKRKAKAKFKAIDLQNKLIVSGKDEAIDGRRAKREATQQWQKRYSSTVDYRYYRQSNAKPSAAIITKH